MQVFVRRFKLTKRPHHPFNTYGLSGSDIAGVTHRHTKILRCLCDN